MSIELWKPHTGLKGQYKPYKPKRVEEPIHPAKHVVVERQPGEIEALLAEAKKNADIRIIDLLP